MAERKAKSAPAVKKAAPVKKPTAKAAAKPAAAGRAKGDKLVCEVCGLGVVIDRLSDSVEFSELICCGEPMKKKRAAKAG